MSAKKNSNDIKIGASLSEVLDLPDDKLSEDARLIKKYFISLIRCMPNNVYWVDKNAKALGCNDNVLKLLGVDKLEDVLGKGYEEIAELAGWNEAQALSIKNLDLEVIETGKAKLNIERPAHHDRQGNEHYYLSSRIPLYDDDKNVVGVLGITVDMTDHKKRQKFILDEKIKVLQLMGGAIAHELRTPLATINLAAQAVEGILPSLFQAYHLAVDHKLMEPIAQEARFRLLETVFENIKEEVKASNVFINNMLLNIQDLAVEPADMEILSIKQCVEEAMARFPFDERPRKFTQVQLGYDFLFKGMPVLMQHVIFNLLRNGIYYVLESSKEDAGIKIWTEQGEDDWNILHFKDTGTGISIDHMNHVFERFFSKRYHGTGVGLAFCKQVITQFGGTIACDSKLGEYTHFVIRFPTVNEKKEMIQG
jgi:signal transduction histidine kinase